MYHVEKIARPIYGRRVRDNERGKPCRVKVNHRAGVEVVR